MTASEIEAALRRLGEILRDRRVSGEIAVFGGAAVVLGFGFREGTRDLDVLVTEGHGEVVRAAQEVETELRLPPRWLNERATAYLSRQRDFRPFRAYPSEGQFGLRVLLASAEYMLAMKLLALRVYSQDVADVLALARRLGCTTEEGLAAMIRRFYPGEEMSAEKRIQLEEIARQLRAPAKP